MATVSLILAVDVLPDDQLTFTVPGLREGDMKPGDITFTIDGVTVAATEFIVNYHMDSIVVFNKTTNTWQAGATAVLTWEGFVIEPVVHDHETRIAALEANLGVTDGSDATEGQIGEYLNIDNIVGVVPTANIPTQICSLPLPPGCWEIWGACDFTITGTVVDTRGPPVQPNQLAASISLHPDGLPTQNDLIVGTGVMNLIYSPLSSGQRQVLITGQCRSNSVDGISLYLVAAVGSANANVKGYMSARRMR